MKECLQENNCLLCGEEIEEFDELFHVDKVYLCPFKKCRKGFVNERSCQFHVFYTHHLLGKHRKNLDEKKRVKINKEQTNENKENKESTKDGVQEESGMIHAPHQNVHESMNVNEKNTEYKQKELYTVYYHNKYNSNKYGHYTKYNYKEEAQEHQQQKRPYEEIEPPSEIEEKPVYYENPAASRNKYMNQYQYKNPTIYRHNEMFDEIRNYNKWDNKYCEEPKEEEEYILNNRNRRKEYKYVNDVYPENHKEYRERKERNYERNKDGKIIYEPTYDAPIQKGGKHSSSLMHNVKKAAFNESKYMHSPISVNATASAKSNLFKGEVIPRQTEEPIFKEEPKYAEPANVNVPKYVQMSKQIPPTKNKNLNEPWVYSKGNFKTDYTKCNTGITRTPSNKQPLQNIEENSNKQINKPTTQTPKDDDYGDLEDLM